jgi:diketogulonate reductase-like aldo/keto reductase
MVRYHGSTRKGELKPMQPDERKKAGTSRSLSRREFVQRLAAATAGSGFAGAALAGCALSSSQRAEAAEAVADKVGKLPRHPLGTRMGGMEVTPVVMSHDWPRELYAPALAAGINFVHKAGYWRQLPEEFQKLPRESFYTDITVDSTPNNPDDEEGAYNQVAHSLEQNGLRYYDIMRCHFGWRSVREMKERRGTHRAFERLKKEGKVRYLGVSQHPYVPYPEIIAAEIEEGLIDSMQVWFSYGTDAATQQIFAAAHKAGIGMTAMKVYQNGQGAMSRDSARQAELKAPGMVGRSLVRHVLSVPAEDGKPIFNCCVSSLRSFEMFEENVGAVSPKVAAAEGFRLPYV